MPNIVTALTAACLSTAATTYHVPEPVLYGLLAVEGGKVGETSPNHNKTFDMGPFQINSVWIEPFRRYWKLPDDATAQTVLTNDGCANALAAAALLTLYLQETHDLSTAIGHYHSKTPKRAEQYRARFEAAMAKLNLSLP